MSVDAQEDRNGRAFKDWGRTILVAIFFSLGFLSWSFYSLSVGLGFVRLDIAQLALGAVYTASYAALVLLISWISAGLASGLTQSLQPVKIDSPIVRFSSYIFLGLAALAAGL